MLKFGRLDDVLNNLRSLNEKKIVFQLWNKKEVQAFVLHLNRVEQLFEKGIDSNGDIIGRYRSRTERIHKGDSFSFGGKTKQKRAGQPYTLFEEGDFYRSFKIRVVKGGIFIVANEITDDGSSLTERYGIDILGIDKKSNNELVDLALDHIIRIVRKEILK